MIQITRLFKDFTNSEKSAGFVLIVSTILSLLLANVFIGDQYNHFFDQKIGFELPPVRLALSIEHWVNDGLMTIFFLLVGLEIEREMYIGELSTVENASLPVAAAIGGMAFPFLVHLLINNGTAAQQGGGIPMATDIAFALGILSLSGKVPYGLKVFLTAFAIIDDLGAVIIIAAFYTQALHVIYLFAGLLVFGILIIFNRLKMYAILPYVLLGFVMWYCLLQSGVHATVSGILLAFALPFGSGDKNSPSYKVQQFLHKPVAFLILPVFALVNTGVMLNTNLYEDLLTGNSLGIILGLVAGKPLGIMLLSYLVIKLGWSQLPTGVSWTHLWGAGLLGGIGFTMSIFITLLAFSEPGIVNQSKTAILMASILASLLGSAVLSANKGRARSILED